MFNLHRLLALMFCLLLGCVSTSQPSPKSPSSEPTSIQLRLASSNWPPFVDTADNPRMALDLVAMALTRSGFIANNEVAPLDAVISGLQNGTYDGSAALWRNEEREQFLLYSAAYLENRLMLVGRKGSEVSATSFAQLAGKKIGIVEGYAYGSEVDQARGPIFVRGVGSEENLRALLHGELDYVLADALVIHHVAQQYPRETREKLAIGTTPLIRRTLHLALRKNLPDAQRIIDRFNRALAEMLRDGSYHVALHVDWIQADVNGDGTPELVAAGDKVGVEAPSSSYHLVSFANGGTTSDAEPTGGFVIKGVAYDTWQAVPDDYKTPQTEQLGAKPTSLRVSVFEF